MSDDGTFPTDTGERWLNETSPREGGAQQAGGEAGPVREGAATTTPGPAPSEESAPDCYPAGDGDDRGGEAGYQAPPDPGPAASTLLCVCGHPYDHHPVTATDPVAGRDLNPCAHDGVCDCPEFVRASTSSPEGMPVRRPEELAVRPDSALAALRRAARRSAAGTTGNLYATRVEGEWQISAILQDGREVGACALDVLRDPDDRQTVVDELIASRVITPADDIAIEYVTGKATWEHASGRALWKIGGQ